MELNGRWWMTNMADTGWPGTASRCGLTGALLRPFRPQGPPCPCHNGVSRSSGVMQGSAAPVTEWGLGPTAVLEPAGAEGLLALSRASHGPNSCGPCLQVLQELYDQELEMYKTNTERLEVQCVQGGPVGTRCFLFFFYLGRPRSHWSRDWVDT